MSFAILGLREVVGNLAGVIFSEASGKGSYISLAVKLPGSFVSLAASGEFVIELASVPRSGEKMDFFSSFSLRCLMAKSLVLMTITISSFSLTYLFTYFFC